MKEYNKKLILLGDAAVGKTSLIRRLVVDQFDDKYISTIGTKITAKELQITIDEAITYLKLQIWDILGQKGYTKLHHNSFRGTNGVFMVADITRKDTLQSLKSYWIPEVENLVGSVPFIILANKSDLIERAEFNESELREFASKYKVPFYLTSAKNGENVNRAFHRLGERMLKSKEAEPVKPFMPVEIEIEKNEIIELIDRLIDDFCREYGNPEGAMPILRKQFELAKFDPNHPTQEAIISAIERLASFEMGFKKKEIAETNLLKRLRWIKEVKWNG
ncbi:MAG: GTP-binding protein [Thermoplasmata archaeon]|nr:MAG: GTP-binding protein [Thermoplasmata archaeon]